MSLLRRVWQSPRLIPILSILTVISLAGAAFAVAWLAAAERDRHQDRIASDIASCTRGNVLRLQVIALEEAGQDTLEGILDVVLPLGETARVDQIRAELEPVLAQHQARIDDIELTDCDDVVVGATTTAPK